MICWDEREMKMSIKQYEQLSGFELDVFKELGSIGSGNAATALSGVLNQKISMSVPDVQVLENNDAVARLGGPEKIVAAVLVKFSGEIDGIILYLQNIDYINHVLESVLGKTVECFEELNQMDESALTEVTNIMISSYINAIAAMTGISVSLSVPAFTVNMLGAIMSVPMTEFGYEADKLMIIDGNILFDEKPVESNLIMVPDVKSLNIILGKLGVLGD